MDLGQPRIRLRLGQKFDRRRWALCRTNGGCLHGQPARLLVPRSVGNQGLQSVLVSNPGNRPRTMGQPRWGTELASDGGEGASRNLVKSRLSPREGASINQ